MNNLKKSVQTMFKSTSLGGVLILTALALGCGTQTSSAPEEGVVTATLTEFTIQLDRSSVAAGKVTFRVKNTGKMEHELIVLKTDAAPDKIPVDPANTAKVDESTSVGEVSDVPAGETKSAVIELTPGKYVLICNKPGHYAAGQHVAFLVP